MVVKCLCHQRKYALHLRISGFKVFTLTKTKSYSMSKSYLAVDGKTFCVKGLNSSLMFSTIPKGLQTQ